MTVGGEFGVGGICTPSRRVARRCLEETRSELVLGKRD
jgi:hypothetical protein